ncbi:adenylate cyclase [Nocardioides scoriae]|uniref:Adenylate cyclase n=1 Tax=Nocardioides scoriae TaxID=642780 RepID=A0A1H1XIY3_9ACTN|nr:adenylate/guanylate cyclase domain-containing protein [Nocardioides scoriae]SDT09255.1 adenylate cyclase [Nocardioides scoriae]
MKRPHLGAPTGGAYGSVLLGPAQQRPRRLRVRVQLLLTVLLVGTNVIGAGIVFVLSALVIPSPAANRGTVLSLAIGVPVYVVVAVLVGASWGTAGALRSLRWATREDEQPTTEQRVEALGVPWFLTKVQATLWAAATLLFTLLAVVVQPERAITTAFTVGIAALVVTAIAYLFSEFALRPIAARALSGEEKLQVRRVGVRRRMLLFWGLGTGAPVVGLLSVAIFSLTLRQGEVTLTRLAVVILALGGVVLVFGSLVTWLNARAVVAPILAVRNAMERVEAGDLDGGVQVYDGTELGQLQAGFNQMVAGLRDREHLRDMFGRHVGREVAEAAARGEVELGGETRVVSVLFVDIVGSTELATEKDPAAVVELLNRFFAVVVEVVDERGGLVNKFIGDAALAVFGAPVELADHAGRALAAAREIAARIAEEVPELKAGIGVSTGEAVAGNVGDRTRFEYTVIGDAVNSAARLTELAKDVDGCVLASMAAVDAASDDEAGRWQEHDTVTLRGRRTPTTLAVPRG